MIDVQLPKDWKWVRLGEMCEKVEAVKRKEKKPEEELLYLDIGGIDNSANKILSHKNYKWKDAPSRAQQIVFKDDILFSTVRTYMKNIAVVENKIYDGQIASSGFCVIRSDKKVTNPKFVFYYTVSQNFLRPLNELQTGSSYPAVRDKDVFIQPFPLPPQPIQQAIVSKIEELFSELDKGIENLRTAQQQLKIYRQSVLKWAFEGKLTNENVKEHELPKGWKWVKLSEVAEKITDGEHFRPPTQESGIPFLSAKDVKDEGVSFDDPLFISEETAKKAQQRCNPQRGDILIVSRGATVGRMCIVKTDERFCLLGSVILIKVNKSIDSSFINYVLKSPLANQKMITVSGATAQQAIYLRDIKEIEIPFCSITEQNNIVQEIESRLSVADKMEESISQSLQQAEALRQSILKKAFEGRLV
jgi:type I restriction enzyme S subunit